MRIQVIKKGMPLGVAPQLVSPDDLVEGMKIFAGIPSSPRLPHVAIDRGILLLDFDAWPRGRAHSSGVFPVEAPAAVLRSVLDIMWIGSGLLLLRTYVRRNEQHFERWLLLNLHVDPILVAVRDLCEEKEKTLRSIAADDGTNLWIQDLAFATNPEANKQGIGLYRIPLANIHMRMNSTVPVVEDGDLFAYYSTEKLTYGAEKFLPPDQVIVIEDLIPVAYASNYIPTDIRVVLCRFSNSPISSFRTQACDEVRICECNAQGECAPDPLYHSDLN